MNNIKIATIISYLTLLLGNVISLMYTPFMLATLGSGEYGLFSLTNTIISYIYLLDMGFGNAVIRYNSKYMAEKDEIGRRNLNGMFLILYCIIAIIAAILGVLLYSNFDSWFTQGLSSQEIHKTKIMFAIAILNLVISFPLNVFSGIIISHEKFIFTKLVTLIRTILNPIIMTIVLLCGYKAIGMLIGSTIFNIGIGFVNVIYCFRVLNLKLSFNKFDKKIFVEIFNFSFFIFLSSIAYNIYWSTDQFILGMFVSSTAIAIYTIGSQLNGYFTSFSNVLNSMFLPKFTKLTTLKNRDNKELMDILIKISRIQYFLATFLLVGFLLVGKQFIKVWAGPNYNNSYYIALLIMFPQLISIIQSLFATLLEAMNKHRVKSFIYLGVALFNLILTLILVKPYGAIGCAMATAIGMLINAILNNIYYSYALKLDMKNYWKSILKLLPSTIIAAIIGEIVAYYINPTSYVKIGIFGLIFTIVYGVLLWVLVLNLQEKDMVRGVLERIKFKNLLEN